MRVMKAVVPAICLAGLLSWAIGVAAQETRTQPKAGVPIEKPKIDPPQDITATGCLARDANRFLLQDIRGRDHAVAGARRARSRSRRAEAVIEPDGLRAPEPAGPGEARRSPHPGQRSRGAGDGESCRRAPIQSRRADFTGVPQPTSPGPAAVPRLAPPSLDNKDLRMIAASCSQSATSTTTGSQARGVTCRGSAAPTRPAHHRSGGRDFQRRLGVFPPRTRSCASARHICDQITMALRLRRALWKMLIGESGITGVPVERCIAEGAHHDRPEEHPRCD